MKLKYDELLSSFAFKFNLRRYNTGTASRDRLYKVPVVGVVSKPHAAWPGDERPGQLQRVALQPDHTHFVMLPSEDEAGAYTRSR